MQSAKSDQEPLAAAAACERSTADERVRCALMSSEALDTVTVVIGTAPLAESDSPLESLGACACACACDCACPRPAARKLPLPFDFCAASGVLAAEMAAAVDAAVGVEAAGTNEYVNEDAEKVGVAAARAPGRGMMPVRAMYSSSALR